MASLNNKKDRRELSEKFIAYMENKEIDLPYTELFRMIWLDFFQKYRAIFFMQRCLDGMRYKIAWEQACSCDKQEILSFLQIRGWN